MGNLLLFLQMFPLLLQAIQAIEAAASVPKAGAAKLGLLTNTVKSVFAATNLKSNSLSEAQLLTWIETITATIVTFYNVLGVFKTSA